MSGAAPPPKPLTREQLATLREHLASMPAVPEPDPDPEVNVEAFDEGCEFDDWAESQLDKLTPLDPGP